MIVRSAIKSSARINVVVLYLTQIVEKLKVLLTWLTIWQYMSTYSLHASQPRMQRTSCQVTLNAVLNLNFLGWWILTNLQIC